ncbi:methylation-associated defense system restriction endonuclease subunit S MAD5 [Thermomonospora umbrina]|uniref:Type I restriction enzyme S subunit n=1 Tax=Thermomonospora umbrina TaxID=111806 RepID=A0A3D9SIN5_9ACTN|nr:restriction endonuclease subunit S [Thermomonospora umbrina]REE95762.1 hypothetical protein DFJ69_1173 [Thermomonospora umbrina]
MKLAEPDNPVRYSWLADQGFRLSPGPYVSESYAARKLVERLPHTDALEKVTERIFHPGRVTRSWTTDPDHGVTFLSSADIFQSDLSSLAMITRKSYEENARLPLKAGWTLVTRSGMTAGRVTYARLDMEGLACSEHVLRVVPDRDKIPAGYLYTFLASALGVTMIKGTVYGTSVKHIESSHLSDLPIPRINDEIERQIDSLFQQAMTLRVQFQNGITEATQDFFESAGLPELSDLRWHDLSRDTDFSVSRVTPKTLRSLNFGPRAQRIIETLRSTPHRSLGDICQDGYLRTGARFKRVDASPANGVRLIGQRQAFWMRPEGRWINPRQAPADVMQKDETILIAAHGTLGDTEVYSRSVFVTRNWLAHAYSQDFVRMVSGDPEFPGAYLFAFFRSEAAFRLLRSMSVGGKQQEYHPSLLRELPVPECTPADRDRIAETVRQAYRWRDEADALEDKAQALLSEAIRDVNQG